MTEGQRTVLELLAQQKITAEDANDLIEAMERSAAAEDAAGPESDDAEAGLDDWEAPALDLDDLFDIDSDFVEEFGGLGFSSLPFDRLIELRLHDVDVDQVRAMQQLGYDDLAVEQLVSLRIHDVTPEFVRDMQRLGLGNLAVEQLVDLRIHGVDAPFVDSLRRLGYTGLTAARVIELKLLGTA